MEVTFSRGPGTMEPTADDRIKVKIGEHGEVMGFHIMEVSSLKGKPRFIDLTPAD
ncbi:MAG: hypothetical protein L0177_08160 [Chloroflexi bacterium]|nr:hypothetical protein [Chloroflexota bacterium]